MQLICDPCKDYKQGHERCARTVRAFIYSDGPDTYVCECHCNRKRLRQAEGDRKIADLLRAYRREFGVDALRTSLSRPGVADDMVSSPEQSRATEPVDSACVGPASPHVSEPTTPTKGD